MVFNEDVEINGSLDVLGTEDETQLEVQGVAAQSTALQTWKDSGASVLAQVTSDGRLQVGDDLGFSTPDSLVEAHRDEASTTKPKRGFHSLGQITNLFTDLITWVVAELELLGTAGVNDLQTAFRARLTHGNSGDSTGAQLRAGDFESINQTGSSDAWVGSAVGVRGTASNSPSGANAYLTKAVGVEGSVANAEGGEISEAAAFDVADPANDGTIITLYGLHVPDLTQGGTNYAIHTGEGSVHVGDDLEVKVFADPPVGNPPDGFVKVYPKLDAGIPKLYAKDSAAIEHELGGGSRVVDAQYVTLAVNPELSQERVLTPGNGLSLTDSGAGANVTLDVNVDNSTLEIVTDVLQAQNDVAQWNANQLQGRNVASTAPSDGQALVWDGANSQWQPGAGSGHFEDNLELKVLDAPPDGNPPAGFIKTYPKLRDGKPRFYAKDENGIEHEMGVEEYSARVKNTRPTNLLAYWRLNESSGTSVADSSGNGHGGTASAVTWGRVGIGDGNPAGYFVDASNSSINIYSAGLSAAFNGATGTALIWFRTDDLAAWTDGNYHYLLLLMGSPMGNDIILEKTNVNNTLHFQYAAGYVFKNINITITPDTISHCLALTWDHTADEVKAFMDGEQVGTTQTSLGTWNATGLNTTLTVIGANGASGTVNWAGYLAHVALWDVALSATEIDSLAKINIEWGVQEAHTVFAGSSTGEVGSIPTPPAFRILVADDIPSLTAAKISDFDAEVGNNTDVAANTAHRQTTSGNPHNVIASDVGNTTAQWNANQIQDRTVAATAPADGQVLVWDDTASQWGPGDMTSTPPPVAARYTTNAGQSFATGIAEIIDFEDLGFDTNNAVTTGASWKFTAPQTGFYSVSVLVELAATVNWLVGERAVIQLFKNGVLWSVLDAQENHSATSHKVILQGDDVIQLTGGDYIDVRLTESSGGNLALTTTGENNHVSITSVLGTPAPIANAARYSSNAGQSFTNGLTTIVNFEDIVFDPMSSVTVGAAWKFTASEDGYYQVSALVEFAATTNWVVGERARIELFKNGVLYSGLDATENHGATSHKVILQGDDVVWLADTEYIDVRLTQSSGAALALVATNANNHVNVVRVG